MKVAEDFCKDLEKGDFCIYKLGFGMRTPVTRAYAVETADDDKEILIIIEFGAGKIVTNIHNLTPVLNPGLLVMKCDYCFMVKNNYDEIIGYVVLERSEKDGYKNTK